MTQNEHAPETTGVSVGFVIAMMDEEETLVWPGTDGTYYITAKRCGVKDEDAIANTAMQLILPNRSSARGQEVEMVGSVAAGMAFVEKCVRQITAFRIPVKMRDHATGQVLQRDMVYNPANGGDNRENRRFYEFLADERNRVTADTLTPEQKALIGVDADRLDVSARDMVEGFLDTVQGRNTPAQKDFERLGNALMVSRSTT